MARMRFLGFGFGRCGKHSSSLPAIIVAAISLLCLSSCGAITGARGAALPVDAVHAGPTASFAGGVLDARSVNPTSLATRSPPSPSAPPSLAPVFQLSRPEMLIRPPGAEPLSASLVGSELDVRRYIVQIAPPSTQTAAAAANAPRPPAPPQMQSLSDAQSFLSSSLPAFDSARLTHVFPSAPLGLVSSLSSSTGAIGGPPAFHGFSAFLRPSEVDALRNASAVQSLEEDSIVKLDLRPGVMRAAASAAAASGEGGSIGLGVQPSNTASHAAQSGRAASVDAANLKYASVALAQCCFVGSPC